MSKKPSRRSLSVDSIAVSTSTTTFTPSSAIPSDSNPSNRRSTNSGKVTQRQSGPVTRSRVTDSVLFHELPPVSRKPKPKTATVTEVPIDPRLLVTYPPPNFNVHRPSTSYVSSSSVFDLSGIGSIPSSSSSSNVSSLTTTPDSVKSFINRTLNQSYRLSPIPKRVTFGKSVLEVEMENLSPAEQQRVYEEYLRLTAESNAAAAAAAEKDAEVNRLRQELINATNDPTAPQSNVSISQLDAVTASLSRSIGKTISEELKNVIPQRRRRAQNGGYDENEQNFLEWDTRPLIWNNPPEILKRHYKDCKSLLIVKPVKFNEDDVDEKNSNVDVAISKVQPWKGFRDHRVAEMFLIEFDQLSIPILKNNKSCVTAFFRLLRGPDTEDFVANTNRKREFHHIAIDFLTAFSTPEVYHAEAENFSRDNPVPGKLPSIYAAFWLRRLRWNPNIDANLIMTKMMKKVPIFERIIKDIDEDDEVEEIIGLMRKYERSEKQDDEKFKVTSALYDEKLKFDLASDRYPYNPYQNHQQLYRDPYSSSRSSPHDNTLRKVPPQLYRRLKEQPKKKDKSKEKSAYFCDYETDKYEYFEKGDDGKYYHYEPPSVSMLNHEPVDPPEDDDYGLNEMDLNG
ncbi:unnamed protein product [Allacma fusca]|uniref:Uncharacterized protein n=1 Tax=Allacma fusca TaxID=39272 RepID=A0A8J2PSG1_9HEXA|nr:unnamed protein product [Allacma fusca]